jgi:adenylate kinase family enzyme
VCASHALYCVALTTSLVCAYTDIKEGKIVPVEITVKLILAAMQKSSKTKKFLIDGFPRSMNNYEVRRGRAPQHLRQEWQRQQPGR